MVMARATLITLLGHLNHLYRQFQVENHYTPATTFTTLHTLEPGVLIAAKEYYSFHCHPDEINRIKGFLYVLDLPFEKITFDEDYIFAVPMHLAKAVLPDEKVFAVLRNFARNFKHSESTVESKGVKRPKEEAGQTEMDADWQLTNPFETHYLESLTTRVSKEFAINYLHISADAAILCLSVDMDECLLNHAHNTSYYAFPSLSRIERLNKYNESLLNYIETVVRSKKFQKIVLFIGSARQSLGLDMLNSSDLEDSCIFAIKNLAEIIYKRTGIPCYVQQLLSADIYNRRPHGDSFAKAEAALNNALAITKEIKEDDDCYIKQLRIRNKLMDDPEHCVTIHEKYKYHLLYSQLHLAALMFPDQRIEFHFFDDRHDILHCLGYVYRDYSYLVPDNITLTLHIYSGSSIHSYPPIVGVGNIDFCFEENVIRFMKIIGVDLDNLTRYSYTDTFPWPPHLTEFSSNRVMKIAPQSSTLRQKKRELPKLARRTIEASSGIDVFFKTKVDGTVGVFFKENKDNDTSRTLEYLSSSSNSVKL